VPAAEMDLVPSGREPGARRDARSSMMTVRADRPAVLLNASYDRHEVLHMLARPMASHIHATLTDKQPYDHARHVAALRALPAPGEPEREQLKLESAHRHRSRASNRRR
jgi:hypothetical protein